MDDLFNKIYSTEFLFEVFSGLDEGAIKDYYALFISSMAYSNGNPYVSNRVYATIPDKICIWLNSKQIHSSSVFRSV